MRPKASFITQTMMVGLAIALGPLGFCRLADAQQTSNSDADAPIRASAQAFVEAFNEYDAIALANMWTADGEYVNESGDRFVGREAIEQEYRAFFEKYPEIKITTAIDSIRFLSPTTAIEDGLTIVEPTPGPAVKGRYTAIHVLKDGRWLMASVRDGRIAQPTDPDSELSALIGEWKSEHEGVTAELSCDWIADKSFLERKVKISRGDELVSSSVEIIGWDPVGRQFRSWTFSSPGGRSVGSWTPTPEGWLVQHQGLTTNGLPTTSVNWWAPLQDGAWGWSAANRTVGNERLPNPRDVVFLRADQSADN